MRIKRTLIDDLEKIYYSLKCETEENKICTNCDYCKNKKLCNIVYYLMYLLRKSY